MNTATAKVSTLPSSTSIIGAARLRGVVRATVRLIAFSSITMGVYLCWLIGLPFTSNRTCWRHFIFRTLARTIARIVGMQIEVRGTVPSTPFFLVSNHLSYVDIVLFASQVDCVFIAKSDVRNWPLIGLIAESMDTIFINRESRCDLISANAHIEDTLRRGESVILFAEGTSTRGKTVLPFKPSLLDVAARMGIPVSFASVTYRTPDGEIPADLSVCWWGDMTFASHFFNLLKLPEFHARLTFGSEPIQDTNRKQLARALHQSITNQFIPVVKS